MLWYCRFEWYPHTTRQQVAQRILEQHQARGNRRPEILKGWYNLAGGLGEAVAFAAGENVVDAGGEADAMTQRDDHWFDVGAGA